MRPSFIDRLRWSAYEPVDPEGSINKTVMARTFAYLFGAGGTLVLLTLVFPGPSDRSAIGVAWPAIVAYGVALTCMARFDRLPIWFFRILPGIGAVLISFVIYSGGHDAFAIYSGLYFWVMLSAFYLFSWREAAPNLVLVAVGCAVVLALDESVNRPVLHWMILMGTLLVASLLLSVLRRRIEGLIMRMRESDRLKTTLIRSVSHDLRSPLTAIVAAGESANSETLDAETRREVAGVIVSEAARLADMVDKLLDLSRLEAGTAAPRKTRCSVEEIVDAALERVVRDRTAFRVTSPAGELPMIWADAAQVERAFANLLQNAHRFSGEQPIDVTLEPNADRVTARVTDRGPGIPEQDVERIFEPFYQASAGRDKRGGSGLGLAIVRGFIEANGGRVWVEARPDRGTTFIVELPLEDSTPQPRAEGAARSASTRRPLLEPK